MTNEKDENFKKEVDPKYSSAIPEISSNKLYDSIVRIETEKDIGTGFFMKFKIKGEQLFFLFTNEHVIPQETINPKKK